MKRKIFVTLLILICFLLQCTLFKALALGGIVPNLLIVITSSFGFMRGKKEGLFVGFFCGFLIDIFYSDLLGLYALVYMFVGYGNGFLNRIFYKDDVKLPILFITASDFVYCIVSYVLMFLLRTRMDFFFYLKSIILPEVIYTVVVTIGLYRVILFMNRKLEENEKRSATKFV